MTLRLNCLAVAIICFISCSGELGAQTISASSRGSIDQDGNWNQAPSGSANFKAFRSAGSEFRNFFQFNSSKFDGIDAKWVTDGNLVVSAAFAESRTGTYTLRQVVGSIDESVTFFNDLGDGTALSADYSGSNIPLAEIELNSVGLLGLNNASVDGTGLIFGGHISSATGDRFDQSGFVSVSRLELTTVDNTGPTALSLDYVFDFNEDTDLALDASGSTDPDTVYGDELFFEWDVNGDNTFDFSTSSDILTVTKSELEGAGLVFNSSSVYNGTLRVTDRWGAIGTDSFTITTFTAIPEPATLFSLGAIALFGFVYIKRRKAKQLAV